MDTVTVETKQQGEEHIKERKHKDGEEKQENNIWEEEVVCRESEGRELKDQFIKITKKNI